MDFEYSEEQRLLSETLRRFLATGYNFDARAKIIASPAGWSADVWAALGQPSPAPAIGNASRANTLKISRSPGMPSTP